MTREVTDPAIEAAKRALVTIRGHGNSTLCEVEAAREALKPIREIVQDMRSIADRSAFIKRDLYAYTEALEKLVFSTEELEELERREEK